MLLRVLRAENSGWNLTGETNRRAALKESSRKCFQLLQKQLVCFSLWEQAASAFDTKAAAGQAGDEGFEWQSAVFLEVWGIKRSTRRHRWMHHSGFTHALAVLPDYFIAFEQQSALKERTAFWLGAARVGLDQSMSLWFAAEAWIQIPFIKFEIKPACLLRKLSAVAPECSEQAQGPLLGAVLGSRERKRSAATFRNAV